MCKELNTASIRKEAWKTQIQVKEWDKIPTAYCEKLEEGYLKSSTLVKQFRGHENKYKISKYIKFSSTANVIQQPK